jgi:hypothetical protein
MENNTSYFRDIKIQMHYFSFASNAFVSAWFINGWKLFFNRNKRRTGRGEFSSVIWNDSKFLCYATNVGKHMFLTKREELMLAINLHCMERSSAYF